MGTGFCDGEGKASSGISLLSVLQGCLEEEREDRPFLLSEYLYLWRFD
jgi:hypothetical protein